MQFVELTKVGRTDEKVYVNPTQVLYVQQDGDHAVVRFSHEAKIEVQEDVHDAILLLNTAMKG